VIPGLLTDGFGGPVLELASRRCGWSGRFTIATNLIWRWKTFMDRPRIGGR